MSVEVRRPSRLGIRSLARKTSHLAKKLNTKTWPVRPDNATMSARTTIPKVLIDRESSQTLLTYPTGGGAYSVAFNDFWSCISLQHGSAWQNPGMDEQLGTGFFGNLPREIREMIYRELWRLAGLGQHIIRTQFGYTHSRCLLHRPGTAIADGEEPWEFSWMAPSACGPVPLWYKREMSSWCDHWRCEEAREERETWRSITRGRLCDSVHAETWTAFLPMMLTCKRTCFECAPSIYDSVAFTITDITLAQNFFGVRHQGTTGHPLRRINLSFRRQADEGSSFEQWVESWSAILRLLDTPGLAAVNLWLDSDIYYERHWLSVTTNVLRRMPAALAHKAAVSLPPDGHRDRAVGAVWLRCMHEIPGAGLLGEGGGYGDG